MEKNLVWLLDDEWEDHELEFAVLREALPEADIRLTTHDFAGDLAAFGKDADVIISQISFNFTREILEQLTRCKGIAVTGSGYNNIDVRAAKELGIPVTNVNGYCAEDLADYVLAAVFHYYKRLDAFAAGITDGRWGAAAVDTPIHRLSRQKLFLIGCGFIGSVTAKRAGALGMQVMVYDPYLSEERIRECGAEPVSLERGLREADFVSVHVALTDATRGLVDMSYFRQMKPTAVLINVSRGPVIRESDLIEALNTGVIAGAVLDVVTVEPIRKDDPLLAAKNILITPHVSYASEEAMEDLRRQAVNNALTMLRGERPRDLVRC